MINNNQPLKMLLRLSHTKGHIRDVRIGEERTEIIVGRYISGEQVAHITIEDERISKLHCKLSWDVAQGCWMVQDLGSSNGTQLNGKLITTIMPLHSGDKLQLGFTFISAQLETDDDDDEKTLFHPQPHTYQSFIKSSTQSDPREYDATRIVDAIIEKDGPPEKQARDSTQLSIDSIECHYPQPPSETIDSTEYHYPQPPPETIADQTIIFQRSLPDVTCSANKTTVIAAGQQNPVDALMRVALSYSSGEIDVISLHNKTEYLIGRTSTKGAKADVEIADNHISRRHCRIYWDENLGWLVEDLNSANGTQLNGENLLTPQPLNNGGDILIGSTRLCINFITADVTAVDRERTFLNKLPETTEGININLTEQTRDSEKTQIDIAAQQEKINVTVISQSFSGFIETLIEANYLNKEQAIAIINTAQANGQTFFRALTEDRTLKFHHEIFNIVAAQLDLPIIETEKSLSLQVQSVNWLTAARAQRFGVLALAEENPGIARIATIDPFDLIVRDRVKHLVDRPIHWLLIYPEVFFQVVRRLRNNQEVEENIGVVDLSKEEELLIRENVTNVDVPRMVDYFLYRASSQGASDIHIEPAEDFLGVRNRIDGILHEEINLPKQLHSEVVSRIKIMSTMDVAEKRRPQDGRFGRIIKNNPIDVRVSTFPTVYGEKVVFRLLDKNTLQPSPEALGLLPRDLRLLRDKLSAPYGLIMLSGPTGSGKTTTLYSCLSAIDKASKNVLTVEDPVEYRLAGVHQMQVNSKIGLTFASGLRTILRQDPDVIMVGECRDAETASMAIQAALTGHIVFSTIHTNDAVGVIPRLLDMKIENFLVATALTLAIAQRLVRKICPHCKTSIMGAYILRELQEEGISRERLTQLRIDIDPDMEYAHGKGCERCRKTGYLGRRAVFEVFEMTNEARNIIMGNVASQTGDQNKKASFNIDALRKHVLQAGMTTLISHGLKLIEDEITTFKEVIRVLGETT